jgi:GTPase
MESTGELDRRRRARARDEIESIAVTGLRERFAELHGDERLDELADRVVAGDIDAYGAADVVMGAL